jgi:hypothetical protein
MTKQTRKFITTLRQQFKAADKTSQKQIWNILTALRGPDNSTNMMEKASTTAVIRQAVFGAKSAVGNFADIESDNENAAFHRQNGKFNSDHFKHHASSAFQSLNLKWDTVNVPKKKIKK